MTSSNEPDWAAALAENLDETTGATPPAEQSASAPPATNDPSGADPTAVWIERVGGRQYIGKNGRGAVVNIGSGEHDERFTPGELLKVALLGCTGLSSDIPLARRLGPDFDATLHATSVKNTPEERYSDLAQTFQLDLSALDPEARTRLMTVVNKAIDTHCTVGRTIVNGAVVTLSIVDESSGEVASQTSKDSLT